MKNEELRMKNANAGGCHAFADPMRVTELLQLPPRKHVVFARTACFRGEIRRSFIFARDPRKHGTHHDNFEGVVMRKAVIIEAVRTPVGRAHPEKGWYRHVRADDLSADI